MSNYRNVKIEDLAQFFKALSNPKRLQIFIKLAECCGGKAECSISPDMKRCVGELGRDLGIVPSTVSHHIKELNRSGLIKIERRGKNIECWINPEALKVISTFFLVENPI
ncbi:MAG: helix-turn-helix transcriptional regulator [candidate division Zixibacteria bacterium]|nr:helix-turn-helix transcriptional regulator [candidate division Zixibacteria bacterium]